METFNTYKIKKAPVGAFSSSTGYHLILKTIPQLHH
jgi:hypothetical protein